VDHQWGAGGEQNVTWGIFALKWTTSGGDKLSHGQLLLLNSDFIALLNGPPVGGDKMSHGQFLLVNSDFIAFGSLV